MQFKDQVDFVRQHIQRNKLRVFMTILAATMGTAFLIVLASIGFGIHDTLRNEMLSNRLVNEIQVHDGDDTPELAGQVASFKKLPHVNAVVYQQRMRALSQLELDDYEGYSDLIISDFVEEEKAGFELQEGRLPKEKHEVVVGSDFGSALYKENGDEIEEFQGELIGQQFSYAIENSEGEYSQPILFTVVGVGENPTKAWEYDRTIMGDLSVIPEIERMYDDGVENLWYGNLTVYADKLENVSQISKEIREQGYYTYSVADELKQLDVFFLALKAGLVFVGTIAILIASIGIFNTMTMAVTERTREIGVLKAIGANPKLIQRLFIMESAWIGVIGTGLAVILSYGVSVVANYVLPIIVFSALGEEGPNDFTIVFSIIPWQLIIIASLISISVAVISGWRPARKATKIDVIQALRQEL